MLFCKRKSIKTWQLSLGWELHSSREVTEVADAFNGFRIPTATQGGPARGQPCSQSPIGLIFAAWGSLHSPVTEGEGDRSTRPPNPSNSPRGLCCYFTVSISKMRKLELQTMPQITEFRGAFANSYRWYSKALASPLRG